MMEYFSTASIVQAKRLVREQGRKFGLIEGSVPVLISVPHCVDHMRDGRVKPAEVNTLSVALMVHRATGCHVIYNCDSTTDPNHDEGGQYKDALTETVADKGIRLVIDLHGAAPDRDFDLEIGTGDGANIGNDMIIVRLIEQLARLSFYTVDVDRHFKAAGANTISAYTHRNCGVPAIQVEINQKNRSEKNPDKFDKTAGVFARFIKMAELCGYSGTDYDCATVKILDKSHPHNRVELPESWRDSHIIDEACLITSLSASKEGIVKQFVDEDTISVGKRLYDSLFAEVPVAIVKKSNAIKAAVYKPKIEAIDNDAVSLSDDIYEQLSKYEYAEVMNPLNSIKAYLKIKRYGPKFNFNNRKNAVWLSSLQRRLLNMQLPMVLPPALNDRLSERCDTADYEYFISNYHTDAKGDLHLNKVDEETHNRMTRIYKAIASCVDIRPISNNEAIRHPQPKILVNCIGNASIMLRAVRCAENDEILEAIKITDTNIKRLGVSDGDKVYVTHRGRSIPVRVHVLSKDTFEQTVRNNNLDAEDDVEMVACIPVALRFRLGISDINECVTIERDLVYIVRKNITEQLLALIGLFIAIYGIPGMSLVGGIVAFLSVAPLVLYSIFSKEREKI